MGAPPIDQVPDENNESHTAPNENTSLAVGLGGLGPLDTKTAKTAAKDKKWCDHCEVNHWATTKCPFLLKQEKDNPESTKPKPDKPSGTSKGLPGNLDNGTKSKLLEKLTPQQATNVAKAIQQAGSTFKGLDFAYAIAPLIEGSLPPGSPAADVAAGASKLLEALVSDGILTLDTTTGLYAVPNTGKKGPKQKAPAGSKPTEEQLQGALQQFANASVDPADAPGYAAVLSSEISSAFGSGDTIDAADLQAHLTEAGFDAGEASSIQKAMLDAGILHSNGDNSVTLAIPGTKLAPGDTPLTPAGIVDALKDAALPPAIKSGMGKALLKHLAPGKETSVKALVFKLKDTYGWPAAAVAQAVSSCVANGILIPGATPDSVTLSGPVDLAASGGGTQGVGALGAPKLVKTDGAALAKSLGQNASSVLFKALKSLGDAPSPMSALQIFSAAGLKNPEYAGKKLTNGLDHLVSEGLLQKTQNGEYFFGTFEGQPEPGQATTDNQPVAPEPTPKAAPPAPEVPPQAPTNAPAPETPPPPTGGPTPGPTPENPAPVNVGAIPTPSNQEVADILTSTVKTYLPTTLKNNPEIPKAIADALAASTSGKGSFFDTLNTTLAGLNFKDSQLDGIANAIDEMVEESGMDLEKPGGGTPTGKCPTGHLTYKTPAPHNCPSCGKVMVPASGSQPAPNPAAGQAPPVDPTSSPTPGPVAPSIDPAALASLAEDAANKVGTGLDPNLANAIGNTIYKHLNGESPAHLPSQIYSLFGGYSYGEEEKMEVYNSILNLLNKAKIYPPPAADPTPSPADPLPAGFDYIKDQFKEEIQMAMEQNGLEASKIPPTAMGAVFKAMQESDGKKTVAKTASAIYAALTAEGFSHSIAYDACQGILATLMAEHPGQNASNVQFNLANYNDKPLGTTNPTNPGAPTDPAKPLIDEFLSAYSLEAQPGTTSLAEIVAAITSKVGPNPTSEAVAEALAEHLGESTYSPTGDVDHAIDAISELTDKLLPLVNQQLGVQPTPQPTPTQQPADVATPANVVGQIKALADKYGLSVKNPESLFKSVLEDLGADADESDVVLAIYDTLQASMIGPHGLGNLALDKDLTTLAEYLYQAYDVAVKAGTPQAPVPTQNQPAPAITPEAVEKGIYGSVSLGLSQAGLDLEPDDKTKILGVIMKALSAGKPMMNDLEAVLFDGSFADSDADDILVTIANTMQALGIDPAGSNKQAPSGVCPSGHVTYKAPIPHNCPSCGKVMSPADAGPQPNAPPSPQPVGTVPAAAPLQPTSLAAAYDILGINPGGKGITFLKYLNSNGKAGVTLADAVANMPDPPAGTSKITEAQAGALLGKAMKMGLVTQLPGTSPATYVFGNFGAVQPPRAPKNLIAINPADISKAANEGKLSPLGVTVATILEQGKGNPLSMVQVAQAVSQMGQDVSLIPAALQQLVDNEFVTKVGDHFVLGAEKKTVTPDLAATKMGWGGDAAKMNLLKSLANKESLQDLGKAFGYNSDLLSNALTELNNADLLKLDPATGSYQLADVLANTSEDLSKFTPTPKSESEVAALLGWNTTGKGLKLLGLLNKNGPSGTDLASILSSWPYGTTPKAPDPNLAVNLVNSAIGKGLASQVPGTNPPKYVFGYFGNGPKIPKTKINVVVTPPPPPPPEPAAPITVTTAPTPLKHRVGAKSAPPTGVSVVAHDAAAVLGYDLHDPAQRAAWDASSENTATTLMSDSSRFGHALKAKGVSVDTLQKLINAGLLVCHEPQLLWKGGNGWESQAYTVPKLPAEASIPPHVPPASRIIWGKGPDGKVQRTIQMDPEVADAIEGWCAALPAANQPGVRKFLQYCSTDPGNHHSVISAAHDLGMTYDDVNKVLNSIKGINPTGSQSAGLLAKMNSMDFHINPRVLMSATAGQGAPCSKCKVRHRPTTVCPFTAPAVSTKPIQAFMDAAPKMADYMGAQAAKPVAGAPAQQKPASQLMVEAASKLNVAQGTLGHTILQTLHKPMNAADIDTALKAAGFKWSSKSFLKKAVTEGVVQENPDGTYSLKDAIPVDNTMPAPGASSGLFPASAPQPLPGLEHIRTLYPSDHPVQRMKPHHAQYFHAMLEHLKASTDDGAGNPELSGALGTRDFGEYASAAAASLPTVTQQVVFDFLDAWCYSQTTTFGQTLRETVMKMGAFYQNPSLTLGKVNATDLLPVDANDFKTLGIDPAMKYDLAGGSEGLVNSNNRDYLVPGDIDSPIILRAKLPGVTPVSNGSGAPAALAQQLGIPVSSMVVKNGYAYIKGPTRAELILAQSAVTQAAGFRSGTTSMTFYRGIGNGGPHYPITHLEQAFGAATDGKAGSAVLSGVDSWAMKPVGFGAGVPSETDPLKHSGGGLCFQKKIPLHYAFGHFKQEMKTPLAKSPYSSDKQSVFHKHESEQEMLMLGHDSPMLTKPGTNKVTKLGFLKEGQLAGASSSMATPPQADPSIPPGFGKYVRTEDALAWFVTSTGVTPLFMMEPFLVYAKPEIDMELAQHEWLAEQASTLGRKDDDDHSCERRRERAGPGSPPVEGIFLGARDEPGPARQAPSAHGLLHAAVEPWFPR